MPCIFITESVDFCLITCFIQFRKHYAATIYKVRYLVILFYRITVSLCIIMVFLRKIITVYFCVSVIGIIRVDFFMLCAVFLRQISGRVISITDVLIITC